MQGYQVTFYTESNRKHHGVQVSEWLVKLAKEMKLSGVTVRSDTEGYGRSGRIHSAHFFELADQPLEVTTVVTADEADALFTRLAGENIRLFYVRIPAEFGVVGTG